MDKYLEELKNNEKKILFVHYSCQNLNDDNEELSPRITSLAVLFNNGTILKSFALHYTAEVFNIKREEINENYDKIERKMLEDFFDFARSHYEYYWVHWNMSNIYYGFEALEHRYEVLTGEKPSHIEEEKRFNLSKLIAFKYGSKYVDDPKMKNLMSLNGGISRDFLSGEDEVRAFQNKEYIKMHKSTITKVYFFRKMYKSLVVNEIKTKKRNWKIIFKELFEMPFIQLLSLLSIITTIVMGVVSLISWIGG